MLHHVEEGEHIRPASGLSGGADFLNIAGNLVQLVGIFIALLGGVSAARRSETALYEAEDRLARLQKDVAELDLQIRRARSGR